MTISNLYSLKDLTIGSFGVIFSSSNDVTAQRDIAHHMIVSPDSSLTRFSEQFALYKVGEFNDDTGAIESALEYVQSLDAIARSYSVASKTVAGDSTVTFNTVEGEAPVTDGDVVQFS